MLNSAHPCITGKNLLLTTTLNKQKYMAPTEKYIVQDGGTVLLLPAGLTDVQLKQALLPYEKYKVRNQQMARVALLDKGKTN